MNTQFLPVCQEDLEDRGCSSLDIILVTGDAYVDHPSYGAAVIGRVLENAGFKVGVIAQPDWRNPDDFLKLGKPKLFFGITAGNLDSALSNYSVHGQKRQKDDYSPGGKTGLRPNRATIVYANKVRECFPDVPLIIGGIEASLRRLAHYDYWSNEVRRSILVDSKADMLIYGMGEKATLEVAGLLKRGKAIQSINQIHGTVVVRNRTDKLTDYLTIPSFEEIQVDKNKFNEAFKIHYEESDPVRGKTIVQQHGNRVVVQFPPAAPLTTETLDQIYELPYARNWHPMYNETGGVPGFEIVRFSITSHRGCPGECSFCSLYAHQGRILQSRSKASILKEVRLLAQQKEFKGTITDIGGPTANLYQASCELWEKHGTCKHKKCLMPAQCPRLELGYDETVDLWKDVMKIPRVKHLFISSGLRYDLLIDKYSDKYLEALCKHHVSGLLKVAPEYDADTVLQLMNKPSFRIYEKFASRFAAMNKKLGKNQFLVNYFISAHPGSDLQSALDLSLYLIKMRMHPEQIQDFIPLPMTVSACIYHTGKHPFSGKTVTSLKSVRERKMARALIQYKQEKNKPLIIEALRELKRTDLIKLYCGRCEPENFKHIRKPDSPFLKHKKNRNDHKHKPY
ncbi:MAG: YgiQ family radical SAM protein [Omnitrophica bacterium RIFCSPLOWO2_12_FULL_44_17]|uniref:YgiQ family radical SAM protein n=1 Tax=Candidatus Danuiimicrobium aquiferis TaxID=1801832 RepID=A0A1G1L083_9BACT|nr:MAG: YgiQ family radical SAM protein [Omnitrophica bacterium RIFCSPHIGHO2_02_FULL_45_28]OGW89122.1 MAG: YgiQ family radical SAM protein [Omnitrophica bacterium RIFCSPHIGHO2_12_FULL_44_12]OGW98289.1 MAG: YgiQ family radical SAM protein [Omnitrophica bacterium RIFCSPLOWO2_12_FULL_44_17]OGX02883.1 MAG: YgiQ family radical SAM protein [Omnitrophica bacterium RIFCSPLOWO2_02_FULL_44_11]